MKIPALPSLPEFLYGRNWEDLTAPERNGLIAEVFANVLPDIATDAVRPFRLAGGEALWTKPGGILAVPRYTETWISARRLLEGLVEFWKTEAPGEDDDLKRWYITSGRDGWYVVIEDTADNVYAQSTGPDFPELVCWVALRYWLSGHVK